ncbi:kinase-like protein [Hypoxylon rubiginosum]|uniref:Kinase-like protein n=1 Tax=Hypoxylon rubiginosum TaxID=110542 RepID=A0ACB9YIL8_9PEZI|nr:kinase-like protein [Hypoxylon rubiginosum]
MSVSSNEDIDRDSFGPLLDISEESLIHLATDIRKRCFNKSTSIARYVSCAIGSYNIIHFIQLDEHRFVIRLPITGWGSGKNETAARAMESQVATLRLIARNTTVPVPQVYDFDTTDDNAIGAPYYCMGWIPGKPVLQVWFEHPKLMSREQFRLNILKSLSQIMPQLSRFTFNKVGSISSRSSTPAASDPCYDWAIGSNGQLEIVSSGPFDSAVAYVKARYDHAPEDNVWINAQEKIMSHILPFSPIYDAQDSFVLRAPDFNPQNVMVDEQGNVTGLIDWDLAQTVPRCVGYATYPCWITRDWDPLMYDWPGSPDSEDSPETLERYRAYYNEELGKALDFKGDWRFTEKSHITEAVWIATLCRMNRMEICRKLVQTALNIDPKEAFDLVFNIGMDYYEDWDSLLAKLKRLVNLELESPAEP